MANTRQGTIAELPASEPFAGLTRRTIDATKATVNEYAFRPGASFPIHKHPEEQVTLLRQKYAGKPKGRIPLPRNAQELWAQHKYSVMARSPRTYQTLGRSVARMRNGKARATLLQELTWILRDTPGEGRLLNAVEHMWGYVRDHATADDIRMARMSIEHLLARTQRLAVRRRQRFLLSSTALSELAVFVDLDDRWPDGQDLG